MKRSGAEQGTLDDAGFALYEREYLRLRERLVAEAERSTLPEGPTAGPALKDLLYRIRLASPVGA